MLIVDALLPRHHPLGHAVVRLLDRLTLVAIGTLRGLQLHRLRGHGLVSSDWDLIGLVADLERGLWLLVWHCYLIR